MANIFSNSARGTLISKHDCKSKKCKINKPIQEFNLAMHKL